jgi:protein-tyrosine phosphatase
MSTSIILLFPPAGAVTAPLQSYAWTGTRMAPHDPPDTIRAQRHGIHSFDRSLPRPVRLQWAPANGGEARGGYVVTVSRRPDLAEPVARLQVEGAWVDVPLLHVGTRYYWRVTATDAGAGASAIAAFDTHALPPRWIHAPGITNVRDLGGWPLEDGARIRQGLVYRSSELNGHVSIQPAGRRVLEDGLGIRTDLDLRGEGEPVEAVLDPARVDWLNIPIRPYGEIQHEIHHAGFRRILALFADRARYPVLLHCWGGADRAGTIAYFLHAILGGRAELLRRDYELTTQAIWGERRGSSNAYRTLLRVLAGHAPAGASPRRQVEGFLRAIGVPSAHFRAIRALLREPCR